MFIHGRRAGACLAAILLAVAALGAAKPARARDFCPDRPGLTTPPCTTAPGLLDVETDFSQFSRMAGNGSPSDQQTIGDPLLRYGLTDDAEARLTWGGFGVDAMGGTASRLPTGATGTGDLTLGLRQNFLHPDDSGLAYALQPMLTIPTGRPPIGQGTWSAALLGSLRVGLGHGVALTLDPEQQLAADTSGKGRHPASSLATGITYTIDKRIVLGADVLAERDLDPGGAQTKVTLGANAAYLLPKEGRTIFVEADFGATAAAARCKLLFGAAALF